ncbi:type VI secretion system protein TssA [Actibacterium pelagium]|uniref:ImpA N-terminal domain-containing protein n=1 Tax=Actibacterium pelagium TaxID=2029103 RepID=A0A917ELM7_9RHOB|nr:type VI secretion system protein TssA [Actibacterium pelagium]GGE53729.1 hypothetical protein GCM10011517_21770 [Actibacterium pelagium]
MDVSALLQSHGDDEPSGENLEYDPEFTEMELAAQPGEETQVGDEIRAAEDPNYSEVIEKAMGVLGRSHDLRAAVFLAEAVLMTKGLKEFAEVTTYIRGCLEDYWGTCHPELDEDDDNDPTMRINAVQGLADGDRMIKALRRTALTDSRAFGRLSLRQIEMADGTISVPEGAENVPDTASVNAAFQDTDDDVLAGFAEAISTALADVRAIDAVFSEKTPGQGPELDPTIKTLNSLAKRLAEYTGGEAPAEETAEGDAAPAAVGGGGPAPVSAPGAINSPTDVSNAIDRIISYYERNEPSSPVPLMLQRAKRLVNADFLTIMKDMAPQGVDNVNLIGGIEDDEY